MTTRTLTEGLQQALADAQPGDVFVLEGEHTLDEVELHVPVTLRGGTLVGTGQRVLKIFADVVLEDLEVRNPKGHGIVSLGGAPELRGLTLTVGGTALACGKTAAVTLQRCTVRGASTAMTVQDDARVFAEELQLTSRGCGLFLRGRSSGTFTQVGILAGNFAGVEATDETTAQLIGVAVVTSGSGGFFIHGDARPELHGCLAQQCGLSGVEVSQRAQPTIDGLVVRNVQREGILVKGEAAPTFMEIEVDSSPNVLLRVCDEATVDVERAVLKNGGSAGVSVQDKGQAELLEVVIKDCAKAGVEASGRVQVQLESCRIHGNGGYGVTSLGGSIHLTDCDVKDNERGDFMEGGGGSITR